MATTGLTIRASEWVGLLARLTRDRAGNTLVLVAASIFPLLAVIGGGIDMGRTYLAKSRLQQACDAGVLAARKKLGTTVAAGLPADVQAVGNRFFTVNYANGAFGTTNRSFTMSISSNLTISGDARVDVPTTVMQVFGFTKMPVALSCSARLNFNNTDIMMVLDTTGSMDDTNPGDTMPKIAALRQVVKDFTHKLETSKAAGVRMRYGFVPYSTNVNVGYLLKSKWMVDNWGYNGRMSEKVGSSTKPLGEWKAVNVTGTVDPIAPYTSSTCPPYTYVLTAGTSWVDSDGWTNTPITKNGDEIGCTVDANDSTKYVVSGRRYNNVQYTDMWRQSGSEVTDDYHWNYKRYSYDVSFLKDSNPDSPPHAGKLTVPMDGYYSYNPMNMDAWFTGCIEERDTYEIDDYANVDLSRALDLDIDLVPNPANPATQWRPMFPSIGFARSVYYDGSGTFKPAGEITYQNFVNVDWVGYAACPSPASPMTQMTEQQVGDYVDGLKVGGSTYHDIGMIWGGRLLSPTGLFAADNADQNGTPTNRNLIFLTDGETATDKLSYGTYGIEPLDLRRWDPSNPKGGLTLDQVVEKRFAVACNEVKKRNITVWVISFGVKLNPIMDKCAGPGHAFEAKDAAALSDTFSKIADQLGDLRISK